ncbi:hypothetical protein Vi05172_g9266 [Venturia inaequalis]|nr:hypothetical protein Vi05172_g9266 [Venturia inaequalis]
MFHTSIRLTVQLQLVKHIYRQQFPRYSNYLVTEISSLQQFPRYSNFLVTMVLSSPSPSQPVSRSYIFPKNILELSQRKISHDSQPLPVYATSQPQDAKKKGFLDLSRELRDYIYACAMQDAGSSTLRLYKVCLVSKQLDYEFLETYTGKRRPTGRLCRQRRQIVDPRGGLEMPQLPVRFLCAAIRCKVDIKNSIDTTTVAKCERSMGKTASRLGEALKGASMLKELSLSLVWRGSSGKAVMGRIDIIMFVLVENLSHLPNLTQISVVSSSARWIIVLENGIWVATEKEFFTYFKPLLVES